MFFKLLCFYVTMNACSAEDVFARLYESLQESRVTACAQARACAGLAWRRRWVLARASCLPRPVVSIYVKKGVVNCSRTVGDTSTHGVLAFYKHPTYPEQDLALLQLDWPFASTELIDNHTISGNIINKLDDWLKNIKVSGTKQLKTTWLHNRSHHKMYSTPVRMFLVTVVLPSVSFVVFFLFIIFFTGKSRSNKIPYRSLNNENKETTYV